MDKPVALTSMTDVLPEAFQALKEAFHIDDRLWIDLSVVDATPLEQLSAPHEVAAIAMRKIQLLNAISPTGVPTTNDIVIGLCLELVRAISQLLRGESGAEMGSISRSVLLQTLTQVHSCGVVIGTMFPGGEIVFLL
ncbi:hypothetical protein GCM10023258_39850 [Terrabacter aeriphilus]|uniref:Uncharacterized protein n=1 Tax=Terrabacter aeriphilus TaxID=515662 RepID=A0ABP9JNR4_9MICO